ncbi:MAG: hypothetical protein HC822_21890 [Oscillochloris sp.]|nr:hypothetical protein [Oscillochloris sp.]
MFLRTMPVRPGRCFVVVMLLLGCFGLPPQSLAGTTNQDQPPGVLSELVFGGSHFEEVIDVAVDVAGNSYILGVTGSFDFPTFPAVQSAFSPLACSDLQEYECIAVFVVSLAADGQTVRYSTLMSSGKIWPQALVVTTAGSVFITGYGTAESFADPGVASGVLRNSLRGESDAFLAALNPAGVLVTGGYLGGSGADEAYGLALGPNEDLYLAGLTRSADFPTLAAFQPTFSDDPTAEHSYGDAFVSRLSADLSRMLFSTYLGGRANDYGRALAVGADGSVFVSGATDSEDFPLAMPLQAEIRLNAKATPFVTALSADGATLHFSTYLGGTPFSGGGHAIALSGDGRVLVAINTYQTGAVALLAADGSRLLYEQYLGPTSDIAFDAAGNAYAAITPYPNKTGFNLPPGAERPPCPLSNTHIVRLDDTGTVQATIMPAAKAFAFGPDGMLLIAGYGNINDDTRIGPPTARFGPAGAATLENTSDISLIRLQADLNHQGWQWPPRSYNVLSNREFAAFWNDTDGRSAHPWLWGPEALTGVFCEEFQGKPLHTVQYFAKGRMEWNMSDRAPFRYWVSGGRLVAEMLSGQVQTGIQASFPIPPPDEAIAGDPAASNLDAPTYRALAKAAWPQITTPAQPAHNTLITSVLHTDGSILPEPALAGYNMRAGSYDRQLGHNIAQVFADMLNQRDVVGGDWRETVGLPLSEPYWVYTKVNGVERHILVQPFERRMLTYNPANPPDWQVEFGNTGRHYLAWRYNFQP